MNKKSMLFMVASLCFGAFMFGAVSAYVLNAQTTAPVGLPVSSVPIFSFQNNLRLGDNSPDVQQLQIVLNSDPATTIAGSDVGSKGQESTYFGQLTLNAVRRFQTKYRTEVLDPYGLAAPTGFVGAATRAKLNRILSNLYAGTVSLNASSSVTINSVTTGSMATGSPVAGISLASGAKPLTDQPLPRLYTVQPKQVKKGAAFTLVGAGFETSNIVHIGSTVFSGILPQDSGSISFVIPTTSVISNGTYEIWVENSKGSSRVSGQPINLTVTDAPQPLPVISTVLPVAVSSNGTVTVTGTGFASNGNNIVSGFGTLKDLSSNGTQISFSPRSLLPADVIAKVPVGQTIKIDFYVVNAAGASKVAGSVDLKL